MRSFALSMLVATLAVPDRPPPVDSAKDELAKLDGTWAVVAYEYDGGRLPDDQLNAYPRLIMKAGTYRWSTAQFGGDMKIDLTQTPKAVDYTHGEGPMKGQVQLGIYELQGDIFRDCIAPPGKDRPREFAVPAGSGNTLFVYRRVKE
jgi:uncharacterized protein (TIGR03067 family)